MIRNILKVYLRAIMLLVVSVILFGWSLPALVSAVDWGLVAIGLIGLLLSIPVGIYLWYVVIRDGLDLYKQVKEETKK